MDFRATQRGCRVCAFVFLASRLLLDLLNIRAVRVSLTHVFRYVSKRLLSLAMFALDALTEGP